MSSQNAFAAGLYCLQCGDDKQVSELKILFLYSTNQAENSQELANTAHSACQVK